MKKLRGRARAVHRIAFVPGPWGSSIDFAMKKPTKTRRAPTACACLVAAASLAGCAGQATTATSVSGSTLKVYVGQSPSGEAGAPAQDMLKAEQLALQGRSKVGRFTVVLTPLTGGKISDQARTAISDSSTIAYLGELDPHSSADSLGITNGAGILQITPGDTAIELTQTTKAVSGAPTRYYESLKTYGRTFGRVVPAGNREAGAQAQAMSALHVKRLYVASDGGTYGSAMALAVTSAAAGKGIAATQGGTDPAKAAGADAVFIAASDPAVATQFLDGVARAIPTAKLFAPSTLDADSFAAGLSAGAQRNFEVSSPGFMDSGSKSDLPPAGQKFVADFRAAYGHAPAQAAIFGYAAMSLVLDALRRAGSQANSRSAVVTAFHNTKQLSSVLGTYNIDGNGDTTLAPYVFSHIKAGRLVPFQTMQG